MEGLVEHVLGFVNNKLGLVLPLASISGTLRLQPPVATPAHVDETGRPSKQQQQQQKRSFQLLRRLSKPQPPSQLFSCELCVHSASERAQCQELVTTGSKAWGIGPTLPLAKLYDFAIYFNREQTEQSSLASQFRQQPAAVPRLDTLYHSLRSSSEIDFSLVVRAARNLPIKLVAAEYRRILRGRLAALGHDPGDPGLAAMLEAFSEERLPASIKQGGSVVKGTTLTFNKQKGGLLLAHANGMPIARVHSEPLCTAIM
ncbi:hypothetical protein N2152v2_005895 [Parachlorella kessleri]